MGIIFEIIKIFFVCACSRLFRFTCPCRHWRSVLGVVPQEPSTLFFFRHLSLVWNLPVRKGWLANDPWGSVYLCHTCAVIISTYQHTQFFSLYYYFIITKISVHDFSPYHFFFQSLPCLPQIHSFFFLGYSCQIYIIYSIIRPVEPI